MLASGVTSLPSIVSMIPAAGQTMTAKRIVFLAEVVDISTTIKSVSFQTQDPNGVQSLFTNAVKDPSSNVWSLTLSLSFEGLYQWRVKAVNSANSVTTTSFQSFWVSTSPAGYAAQARSAIAALIVSDPFLAPKFVRLGFHDCVGICDGCVDMTNGDNNGLDIPINALDPIVQTYANKNTNLSRADIWALAALTGADTSQGKGGQVSFPMSWYGRVNCEDTQTTCYNSNNQVQLCNATRGPNRSLPSPDLTTVDLLHWFSVNFGYNSSETVAIMGAHSIGTLSRKNSGFNGSNGWDGANLNLGNEYYAGIVGGNNGTSDSLQTKLNAPNWNLNFVNNSDTPNISNRYQWQRPQPNSTNFTLMLNSDVALVRDLTSYLNTSTGEVTCAFLCQNGDCSVPNKGRPACPYANATLDFAAQYKNDNLLWLNDFKNAFSKMLVQGYGTSVTCSSTICPLTKLPTLKPVTAKPVTAKPVTGAPIAPIPKPAAPVPKPTATAPIPKPAAPVPKPTATAPIPKPAAPVPKPTATAPIPKPAAPVKKPTATIPKPAAPVKKPTATILKPAAPVKTPNKPK
jgi:hypothetical protein